MGHLSVMEADYNPTHRFVRPRHDKSVPDFGRQLDPLRTDLNRSFYRDRKVDPFSFKNYGVPHFRNRYQIDER